MNIIITVGVGLLYSLFIGFLIYLSTITIIPDRFSDKFFKYVPLYPRLKYAVVLYLLSGLLYTLLLFVFQVRGLLVALFCVFVSSQITKYIAESRSETIEESFEEEMKRKREWRS